MVKESYLWNGMYLDSVPEEVIRLISKVFEYRDLPFGGYSNVEVNEVIFSDSSVAHAEADGLLYEVSGW